MSKILPQTPPVNSPVLDGELFSTIWSGWFRKVYQTINGSVGYSGTITTAKLTTGGTTGSMTFVNGVLTSQTAAT